MIQFTFAASVSDAAHIVTPDLTPGIGGAAALADAIERVRAQAAGVGAHDGE